MRVIDQRSRPRLRVPRLVAILVLCAAILIGLGLFRPSFLRQVLRNPRAQLIDAPLAYMESLLFAPELPTLAINMKYRHYDAVLAKRQEALDIGLLMSSETDWVPASIDFGGESVAVRMRLKGDFTDHLVEDKWSFRIKTRGDGQIMGMRRLSIQHPATRNYLWEWAFHQNLRLEGILHPSYRFVNVTLNGDAKGIFAMEEHMAKELLESQQRRAGPIAKFDEAPLWQQRAVAISGGLHWSSFDLLDLRSAEVDFFETKSLAEDPVAKSMSEAARRLLEAFRDGDQPASRVFDVEQTARFLALSKLWGADHGLNFINLRFYYNPVTTRLEPVAYDAAPRGWLPGANPAIRLFGTVQDDNTDPDGVNFWVALLLDDPVMLRAYAEALHRVSTAGYVDRLETEIGEELQGLVLALRREWPTVESPIDALRRSRSFVAGKMNPLVAVKARIAPGDVGAPRIEVANISDVPVEILRVEWDGGEAALATPLGLRDRDRKQPVAWTELPVTLPAAAVNIRIACRVLGSDSVQLAAVNPVPPAVVPGAPVADLTPEDLAAARDFLEWDPSTHTLRLLPGEWNVTGDLVFPAATPVTARGGVTLRMQSGAAIVARGPLEWLGEGEQLIVMEPQESSWGGIVVLHAGTTSKWVGVQVRGTKGIDRPGWLLTGGVTFYESPVTLDECVFSGHGGEDALNILRSTFNMRRCMFTGTASDAIDGDFVDGRITECSFVGIGGDAVDVSGSRVELRDVFAKDVMDKVVSAGEESNLRIINLRVENASIAIASKDLSRVEVRGGHGQNLEIGLAAYIKKPTYGPGWIEAEGFLMEAVSSPVVVQRGSSITLDGTHYEGVDMEVKELYEQGILGK